ncbi:hypothetical protein BP6252_06023 [Coleophoma cylindrospora]|uniref:NACHT domain-containing protein n=1 Tax=Coleophoma cylindrospora TaxID=1849047 RepID=A0A3D8RM58_9HELO|nr:hypothetical protein BP6252_06023 [Coleophoma cylindrospora]
MAPKRKAKEELAGHSQKVLAHEGHDFSVSSERTTGQRGTRNEQNIEKPQQISSSNQHPKVTDHQRADQSSPSANSTNTGAYPSTRSRTKVSEISQQRQPQAARFTSRRSQRNQQRDKEDRARGEKLIQTGQKSNSDANYELIFDTALKVLRLLLVYESSRLFLVYAHENESSEKKASQEVAKKLIHWLNRIGTTLQSDLLPKGSDKGIFFCHSVDDKAVHDILDNQMCLLPRWIHLMSVEKVILCGSELLGEYLESQFYQTYREDIHSACNDIGKSSDDIKESLRQAVENSLDKPGFHHILTEIALLELQAQNPESCAKIIPFVLNGEHKKIFPTGLFVPTSVRMKAAEVHVEADLHKKFFKLLSQIFENNRHIETVKKVYHDCKKISTQERETYQLRIWRQFYDKVVQKFQDDIGSLTFGEFTEKLSDMRKQVIDIDKGVKSLLDINVSKESQECLHALIPSKIDAREQKDQNPQPVPGTCLWALEHSIYLQWKKDDTQRLLWISAYAGCGKSVLSKYIVDEDLPKTLDETCIIYFFFKDTSDHQRSAQKALLSLLHQLISQRPRLIEHILPLYKKRGISIQSTPLADLWPIFLVCVKDRIAGKVVCVLDAIDECEEEKGIKLITWINKFCISEEGSSTCKLRFLVTSRPYLSQQTAFASIVNTSTGIQLDGAKESSLIQKEIDLVIKRRIPELKQEITLPDHVSNYLQTTLLKMKQRTYLWLDLVLKSLPNILPGTISHMKKIIAKLPEGIDAAYESLLGNCRDQEYARKVLEIMLVAYRPLTPEEIDVALSMSEETTSYRSLDLEGQGSLRKNLPGRCGLIITIVDSRVYFIHQTVKEFLLNTKNLQNSQDGSYSIEGNRTIQKSAWKGSFTNQQSHYHMAMTCMRTLLFPEVNTEDFNASESLLPAYARTSETFYWADHYRDCQRRIDIEEKRLVPKNILMRLYGSIEGTVIQVAAAGQHRQIFNLHIDDVSNRLHMEAVLKLRGKY